MSLRDEIFEQPAAIARLLEMQAEPVREVARNIRERDIQWVYLAARGTSDNAGLYAKYLWGAFNGLPVALAAPSLFSVFKSPPKIGGALVVGISQSGQSPDIVSVIEEGRRQGALTLAITNDGGSPLAEASAVSPRWSRTRWRWMRPSRTRPPATATWSSAWCSAADSTTPPPTSGRSSSRSSPTCSRSRTRRPTSNTVPWPSPTRDSRSSPWCRAERSLPVFAVVPSGKIAPDMITLLTELVQDQQVELLAISNEGSALALANTPVQLPERLPEWITPIPAIVPAQLFCYHLTRAKGYNTEGPRGLSKVTLTW